MTNRPTGIAILAILLMLGGAMNLLGFAASIAMYGVILGSIYSILGVVNLIIGISLWGMKPWSRQAAIIMQIIGFLVSFSIIGLIGTAIPGFMVIILMAMIPSLIISLIVILYLMQGSIKDAFEQQGAASTW